MRCFFLLLAAVGLLAMPVRAAAEKLAPGEIVPRFYLLLTQAAAPTSADEEAFFGKEGLNDGLRTLLLSRNESGPPTPIWTFLRRHKDLFLTRNVTPAEVYPAIPSLTISDPFKRHRPATHRGLPDLCVISVFADEKTSSHGFNGIDTALFTLGRDNYLEIGATVLSRAHAAILFDIVYHRLYE